MKKKITVLSGDGIGPEVINQAVKVIDKINSLFKHDFKLSYKLIGACSIDEYGTPITDDTINDCIQSDAVLLGAIGDPKYDSNPDFKVRPEQGLLKLRKEMGLFSNLRPITTYSISNNSSVLKEEKLEGVDLIIFRELTSGLYFGEKKISDDGLTASDLCVYTDHEIRRITVQAFEKAVNRRKKLTLVDKANVLETSRLWRKIVREVSESYPEVQVEYLYVDNAAMQLMIQPSSFDVILTENLFGDILSDLASVITGSIGLLPSVSFGENCALFEPIHGSYPQAKGKDIANPIGTILSLAMLYDYFELFEEANLIRKAVNWTLQNGVYTKDIDTQEYYWCSQVGDLIALYIEENENLNNIRINKRSYVVI